VVSARRKIRIEAGDKIMNISLKRKKVTVSLLIVVLGIAVLLVLPGLPLGKVTRVTHASNRFISKQSITTSEIDAARKAALASLYAQLKAGGAFSEEEAAVLKKFDAGASITELEADTIISRALYNHFIAKKALTKEQQELLDQYTLFVSRREKDILDLKTQKLNERKAATQNAPPHVPQVAPSNDMCAGAEVIPAAGPFPHLTAVTADITDATTVGDPPLPSCQTDISRSIWYTFTPSATANYVISSCADAPTGSTVDDTVMAIYTSGGGCAGPFTEIPTAGASTGCNDDGCGSEALQSVISTQLTAGTTYYIVVWEFGTVAPTAGNTAIQLRVTQNLAPANDTCASAAPLSVNTPVSGTTAFAVNDYQLSGAACFTGIGQTASTATGADVVYSFTASSAGSYSFKVTNYSTANNLVLYAASSCPAATPGVPVTVGTCLAAANRNSSASSEEIACLALTAGQQIFLFVDEDSLTTGSPFTIEATQCTAETEANNTPATANALSCGVQGSINPAADVDFFSLGTPATGSRVFALLDGVSSNTTDYDMRVTTATDTLEYDDLNNDIAFGSLASNVAGTPLTGVASFLRVNHNSAAAVAEPYRLYAVVQPPIASATAETEPNNTTGQANTAGNNYFSGSLSAPAASTDVDIFSFTATAGDLIMLNLDGDPLRNNTPIDGALALLDSAGTVLVSVNDGGSASSTTTGAGSLTATTPFSPAEGLTFRATTTGTYYARVSIGTSSTGSIGAGDYLLSIARNCQVGVTCAGVTCPANITVNNDPNQCSAVVTYTTPTPGTGCGTISCSPASGSAFPVGTTTVTCTSTAGPSCTFTVTVNDTQPPLITCPANVTVPSSQGQCGANVTYANPTITDNCPIGNLSSICIPPSGSFFPAGVTTVNCTITTSANKPVAKPSGQTCPTVITQSTSQVITPGNSISCNNEFGHSDTSYWRAFNLSAFSITNGFAVQSVDIGIEQAISNIPPPKGKPASKLSRTTRTKAPNTPSGAGQPLVVNLYFNTGGAFPNGTRNLISTANFTISDQSGTIVNLPINGTVPAGTEMVVEIFTPNGQTDGNLFFIGSNAAPETGPSYLSAFDCGIIIPTPTAELNAPNMHIVMNVNGCETAPGSSCSFTVTVQDTQPPTITCPEEITVSTDVNQCSAAVKYTPPAIDDDCPCDVNCTVSCTPPSGSTFQKGTTTVTCIGTDAAGNQSQPCSFNIVVNDTQPPTITCPANQTVPTLDGNPVTVNYPAPTVTDNCPLVCPPAGRPTGKVCTPGTTTCTPPSGSTFPVGTTTVNCEACDCAGNSASCSFTVTVVPCVITCPTNITRSNDPNQCGAVVTFAPTASAGCGTVTCSPASGSFFPVGTTTVTCNTTAGPSCSFTVTINDTQPPSITCPANVTALTARACPAPTTNVVNYPAPTVTDNCPGVTVSCVPPAGSTFPLGTTTVTCTATDTSGNTATCSFTVTLFNACVQDDANPSRVLLWNTQTGDYRFCCNGSVFTGRGTVVTQGCTFTLNHIAADRRVSGKMDLSNFKGEGSLQAPAGKLVCSISDRDIRNNTCQCQ
jgi:hypothetical protein